MNVRWKSLAVAVPLLLVVGCVDPAREPALLAIKMGEAAVAGLTPEVQALAPDQSRAAKEGLASAKAAAAKDEWKSAHAFAKDVALTAAGAVETARQQKAAIEAAAARKAAEAKAAWEAAQRDFPAKIDALKKQVAKLAKAKKLPKGVTKGAVTTAKADVAQLEGEYGKVSELAKSNVPAAAAAAQDLMARANRTGSSIGL